MHTIHRLILFCLFIVSCLSILHAQSEQFTMTPVGTNGFLDRPWDLHYAPDGYLWVTEREEGVVVRVDPENGQRDDLIRIDGMSSTAGQDGLLGMALHPDFEGDSAFVYVSYTYLVAGERRQRLARYTFSETAGDGTLSAPATLIEDLPASNDHNSGRLIFGSDGKLYYTIGDQGGNQNSNYCNPILSQVLPSQAEIDQEDWTHYPGKILRLNTDGSIPDDNPMLSGVRSHIYSYGHRNAQGIVAGSNGLIYSNEHGPNTDDEVNIIYPGKNYGWPNVAGFLDDQAYDYCNWSTLTDCAGQSYLRDSCPPGAELLEESSFSDTSYQEPLTSMFAVTDDYNYDDPACENAWICRPNVAPSSIGIYENDGIPGWENSLLVVSLKRGRVYRYKLDAEGTSIEGDTSQYFYTANRYRDIAVAPDGKTFYLLCDAAGRVSGPTGLTIASGLRNPGNILKFTLKEAVAVDDLESPVPFLVYPNPARQSFYIEVSKEVTSALRADLINVNGQVVRQMADVPAGLHEEQIGSLPAGVYWVRLSTDERSWQQRILIQ